MELTAEEKRLILQRRQDAQVEPTAEELQLIADRRKLRTEDISPTNSPERQKEIWRELSRLHSESVS